MSRAVSQYSGTVAVKAKTCLKELELSRGISTIQRSLKNTKWCGQLPYPSFLSTAGCNLVSSNVDQERGEELLVLTSQDEKCTGQPLFNCYLNYWTWGPGVGTAAASNSWSASGLHEVFGPFYCFSSTDLIYRIHLRI